MRWTLLVAAAAVAAAAAWILLTEDAVPAEAPGAAIAAGGAGRDAVPDLPAAASAGASDPVRDASRTAPPTPAAPRALGPAARLAALGPSRRVSGIVRRASDGSPVEGAQLMPAARPGEQQPLRDSGHAPLPGMAWRDFVGFVRSVPGQPPSQWSTDALGWFEVDTLSAHAPALLFTTPFGGDPTPATVVELPPGTAPVEGLDVRLPTGWALSGTVVDEGRRPVPDARVTVGAPPRKASLGEALAAEPHERGPKPYGTATTDATGRFRVRDLAVATRVDEVAVGVMADGCVYSSTDMIVPREHVLVGPADVVLQRAGALAGRVTDGLGRPRSGATVRVEWARTDRHVQGVPAPPDGLSALTGADGRYRLDHVPAGTYLVSARPAERDLGPWRTDVGVRAGETTSLDFVIDDGSTVFGRVTDETGNVVAGLPVELVRVVGWDSPAAQGLAVSSMAGADGRWVKARSTGGAAGGPGRTELQALEARVETDARGEFRFEGVSAGAKRLAGPSDTARRLLPARREFVIEHADRYGPYDFVQGLGLSVRGRVTDVTGAPVADARVAVQPEGTRVWNDAEAVRTGDDGRFEVRGLPAEPMTMWVSKSGFVNLWETVTPGPTFHDLILRAAYALQGVVLQAATGDPVRRYTISVSTESQKMSMTHEDERGEFSVSVDDDVDHAVSISATGFVGVTVERVRPSETAVAPLHVYLQPDGSG